MEIEFEDKVFAQLETDTTFDGGYSKAIVRAFRKRTQLIRSATDERDFRSMKSIHFEKLRGKRSGEYSMRLNDQLRLILQIKGKGKDKVIVIRSIEDYH